jgi:hypothetical protein
VASFASSLGLAGISSTQNTSFNDVDIQKKKGPLNPQNQLKILPQNNLQSLGNLKRQRMIRNLVILKFSRENEVMERKAKVL